MSHTLQKLIIAYAFFILGMMGGFAYLEGADYLFSAIFAYNDYSKWLFSALIALFVMGLMQMRKVEKDT